MTGRFISTVVLVQARRLLLMAAALCSLLPGRASARAPWVYFDWQPPLSAGCPPRAVLEQDVEHALDRSVFTHTPAAWMTVRGVVELEGEEVKVRLSARSNQGKLLGTRELRAHGCAALRNSLGLVLTLLVERDAGPPEPPARLAFGGWAGLMQNVWPRVAVGVGPTLSLSLPSFGELRADAGYWVPLEIRTEGGKRAKLQAVSLGPRLCPRLAGSSDSMLDLRMCGGAQLGVLWLEQTAPTESGLRVRLLAQVLVELRASLRLRAVALELAAGPLVVLSRTQLYAVQEDGSRTPLYRMPLLGLFVAFGLII